MLPIDGIILLVSIPFKDLCNCHIALPRSRIGIVGHFDRLLSLLSPWCRPCIMQILKLHMNDLKVIKQKLAEAGTQVSLLQ